MCSTYVLHHAAKCFDILDVDLSPPLLRIDDDATGVVGVVAGLDQDIELSPSTTDSTLNAGIWSDTQPSRYLVGHQPRDHAFVNLPTW
jgi:hypothetical protein